MVVVAVMLPEVPVMVTAEVPGAAVPLAANVITLVDVAGLAPKLAVTPAGRPEATSVTDPLNGLISVTVIVSVLLPQPRGITTADAEGASVKPPNEEVTDTAIDAVAVVEPEVPVTLMMADPVAVLLALMVSVVPLTVTETPLFELLAARVTAPVKPPVSVTVTASVTLAPWATLSVAEAGVSVKPASALTVREIVVVSVRLPEVPVIVIVDVPTAAVLLAVKVITLVEVAGLVPKVAVTPLGRPLAASDTLPVNGLTSETVMVSVPVAPWVIDRVAAEGLIEKLPPPPGATPLTEHAVPLSEKAVGTAFVVPFHAPLKPKPAKLPPAAMPPL